MKKQFSNRLFVTLVLFFSTISLSTAMAQLNDPDYGVKAKIPFAFTAGETRLPAGEYTIISDPDFSPSMELMNADGSVEVLLLVENTAGTTNQKTPELVFDRIGGKDFLREVRTEDYNHQLAMSRQEKKLETSNMKSESHEISCKSLHKGHK